MNVYDFDKTIYRNDSTVDFYFYLLKRNPSICRYWFKQLYGFIGYYVLKKFDKTEMKKYFYCYLKGVRNVDEEVVKFWDSHIHLIKEFYLNAHREDDLIISASAYFLVNEACKRLNIKNVLASDVNQYTGEVLSPNCHGQQKIERMKQAGYSTDIEKFYSDSFNDTPLAMIARESYLVRGNDIGKWPGKE